MIGLVSTLALMSACSSTTYQIKNEKSDVVDTVPKWYMSNINETEACNLDTNLIGQVKEKDKNRQCISRLKSCYRESKDVGKSRNGRYHYG